jgi:hypothetical protein
MSKKENISIGGGARQNHPNHENNPAILKQVDDKNYVKNYISMLHQYDGVTSDLLPRKNLGEYLQSRTEGINLYDVNIDQLPDAVVNQLARTLDHSFLQDNIWSLDIDEPNYWPHGKKRYLRIYKIPQRDYHPSQHESLKISSYGRRTDAGNKLRGYPGGRAINIPPENADNLTAILATINRELSEELGFTIQVNNLTIPFGMGMLSHIDQHTRFIGKNGQFLSGGLGLGRGVTLTVIANPPSEPAAPPEAPDQQRSFHNCSVSISNFRQSYYLNIGLRAADYDSLKQFIDVNFSPVERTETMDVMMEKYLKYKNKYLQLKKILENQKN